MISIIIPLYNEQENICTYKDLLFPEIDSIATKFHKQIEYIMVNDGSKDDTLSMIHYIASLRDDVIVCSHDVNRGMGAALKTGIARAQGDRIITMDSDLTYRPSEIEKLIKCYQETGADCVYGTPYGEGGFVEGVSTIRLIPSLGVNFFYQIVLWKRVSCVSAIMRLYKAESLKKIEIESDGFDINAEILAKMIFAGMHVEAVPMTLYARSCGESKLNVKKELIANIRLLRRLIQIRWNTP